VKIPDAEPSTVHPDVEVYTGAEIAAWDREDALTDHERKRIVEGRVHREREPQDPGLPSNS